MKNITNYIFEKLVIDKNVISQNHKLVMNDVFCEISLYNFLPRRKQAEISIIMFYINNLENNKVTAQQYFYNRGNSVFRVDNTVTIDLPEKNSKGIYVKKEKDKANWDKFTYYVNRDDGVKIIEHILDGDYSIFKEYDDNFDKEVELMKYDDSKWFKVKLKFLKDNKSAEKSEYILEKLVINKDTKIFDRTDINVITKLVKDSMDELHYDYGEDYEIFDNFNENGEPLIKVKYSFKFPEPKKSMKMFADSFYYKLKKSNDDLFRHTIIKDYSETQEITFRIMNK